VTTLLHYVSDMTIKEEHDKQESNQFVHLYKLTESKTSDEYALQK
jgi:hypothetical protein